MPSAIPFPLSDVPEAFLRSPEQVTRSGESRVSSADDLRQGLYQLLKEDEPRSYFRAIVSGCYDGNEPYNAKKRRQDGNGWMCNLNFRGLEGTLDSARVPYYSLFSGVPTYATFKTSYQQDNPEAELWNTKVADKFTCLLNRWRQFKWHIQAREFEMLFEGWGPLMWEDDSDWRFCAKPARAVLVPQRSPSCLDDRVPYIAIKCEYRVHELYAHIRDNEDGASDRGWNVPAVKWAIKNGTKGTSGDGSNMRNQPWEEWQRKYRDHELMTSYTEFDVIDCAHFFVKEFDGKISHFIIARDANGANTEEEKGFLFRDVNKYESYDQCLNVAFQNTGRGEWHSVKGIGLKSYGYEEAQNRLNCRVVDNAFLSSGLILQMGDAQTKQKAQLRINGAVSFIPEGSTLIDRQMSGNIEGPMAVSRMLENKLAQKIGAFNQRSMGRDDGRGEQPTAEAVRQAASKEGSLSASQIDNYYLDLDAMYSEVFRRVMTVNDKEAKRFIKDCLDAGVPMEALENMEYVRANRLSGYGSPQMRKMAMGEMLPVVSMLPEDGKRAWLNDYIAASQGADKVLAYNPPMDEPDVNSALATIENNLLHEGEVPQVISGMDHVVHLYIHLGDAEERLAPLQQAIEAGETLPPEQLQEAYQYVSALGEHAEEHLSRIENDPTRKDLAKMFQGQLKLLVAFHGKLRSAIRTAIAEANQQAMEQQQALAISQLDQVKLQSAEQKMQIEAMEAQQGMQIKQAKAQQQNALKRWQVGQKNQLDTIQTAEQIRLDRIKTAADVGNKRLNAKKPNGSQSK